MENITNMQEEWKEARFRRMDEALTKIDDEMCVLKQFKGLPQLVISASRIENKQEREVAFTTLSFFMGFITGKLIRIATIVNDGMTVPMEEQDDKT